jgi:glycosyltransferase involved in cell wall biosynthesis
MLESQSHMDESLTPADSGAAVEEPAKGDYLGISNLASTRRSPRVMMLGMRGFPDVQGGVEKHAEKLACAVTMLGWDVEALVRGRYVPKSQKNWCGIRFTRIWAPYIKGAETFIHSFLGVLYAGISRPDILHIHGIGSAFFTPLARAFGLRVVVTCHSLNYEHKKWGWLARSIFRAGEWAAMRFANGRIAVSNDLAGRLRSAHDVSVTCVPNGIDKPSLVRSTNTLDKFGLERNCYALCVARIDEEKRQLDLLDAYGRSGSPGFRLALAGDIDYSGRYARAVAEKVRQTPGAALLGYQTPASLAELYENAAIFVLPSANEGQPIAVLEAVSHGLPVLLSDIAAHREMAAPDVRYFSVGDIDRLKKYLALTSANPPERLSVRDRTRFIAKYDWNRIAKQTLGIYVEALPERKRETIKELQSSWIPQIVDGSN